MKRLKLLLLIASLLMAAALLSSCLTPKRLNRICQMCPTNTVRNDSIAYVHDTTFVPIPGKDGPTVYKESPCDSTGKLKPFNITKEKNGIITNMRSVGDVIIVESEAKDTILQVPILNKETFNENTVTVRDNCEREHRTRWDDFCFWFTNIVGGIGLLYGGFRLLKRKLKRPIV
jgi:hypothetical protein